MPVPAREKPSLDLWALADYTPHVGQRAVHESRARTICLKWARRGGKGRCATFKLLDIYLEQAKHRRPRSLVPSFHAGIVAPTYRNAEQAWMDLQAFVPPMLVANINHQQMQMWLKPYGSLGTGLIEVRSADNEPSLQNWGLDVLWITEAQDVQASAYHKVLPARYSPGRAGVLIAEGIPPVAPDHWFNILYGKGQTDAFHLYFSSKLTYLENPLLTAEEKAGVGAARDFMSDSEWRRHFLAEDPTDIERPMDIRRVLTAREDWEKAEPEEGRSYVAGLDLGKKVDATVLTIWDETTWKLVYLRRITLMDWVVQKESFLEAADVWRPSAVYIDSTGLGDPMYDELSYAGLPMHPVVITAPERERMLNKLAVAIERKKIIVPFDDALVREFDAMRRVRVSQTGVRWQATEGHHDDIVFSCALALSDMPLRDGGPFQRRPPDFYGWENM